MPVGNNTCQHLAIKKVSRNGHLSIREYVRTVAPHQQRVAGLSRIQNVVRYSLAVAV